MRFGADATNSCFKRFRCDRQIVAAVGRARPEPATGERADTVASHQTRDAATACRPALRTEHGMYPGAAYGNFHHQLEIPKPMNPKSPLLPLRGGALPLTLFPARTGSTASTEAMWLFARSGRPKKMNDLSPFDKVETVERQDAIAIERGSEREVVADQRFQHGQARASPLGIGLMWKPRLTDARIVGLLKEHQNGCRLRECAAVRDRDCTPGTLQASKESRDSSQYYAAMEPFIVCPKV